MHRQNTRDCACWCINMGAVDRDFFGIDPMVSLLRKRIN